MQKFIKKGTPSCICIVGPLDNGIAPRAEALINEARTLRVNSLPGSQIYNVEVLAIIDYAIYKR